MKQISIFLIGFLMVLKVHAQQNISALTISNASTVTISVNGNKNLLVKVDGKDYNLNNNSLIGNKTTIAINNLQEGQHSFQVIRNRSEEHTSELQSRFGISY